MSDEQTFLGYPIVCNTRDCRDHKQCRDYANTRLHHNDRAFNGTFEGNPERLEYLRNYRHDH